MIKLRYMLRPGVNAADILKKVNRIRIFTIAQICAVIGMMLENTGLNNKEVKYYEDIFFLHRE